MPSFSRICDVYQGYNYKKDQQATVGYITKMTVGDVALDVNQTCKNPTQATADYKVVAVLQHFDWSAGPTDALCFSGNVSISNKQKLVLLSFSDMVKVTVLFQFTVYEFDPVAEKYFKSATCDADLKGILEKNNKDLALEVANEPSAEVQSPLNFMFNVSIKPQPSAQKITLASGDAMNVVRAWGIAVG
jgi:hypothetical protein